ncbi:ABC transporter substrate-binding protein [Streptomyces sp. SID3343]|uniref:ABC transporter substrate-binding protein n=1 Tax=Streptomyces sp. SID3343 TaxID=2690260 RepID=UPI00136CA89F|nr:ABC transporter substrate-binding protein [Streptomyces sp. SID3343]MYV99815.1 ABC transporter substrate-binding protein [Streptomyces sp. SID3343]
MRAKRWIVTALLAATCLTGCGSSDNSSNGKTANGENANSKNASDRDPSPANNAAPTPQTPASGPTTYPLTVENCGKQYTYPKAPSRVVVMNGGSVAEVTSLLALGLGDRVVANTQDYGASDEPGRAEAIAALPNGGIKLNEMMDIPRESMLGLRPDFVISTYGGGFDSASGFATRADLTAIGANSYVPRATCGGPGSIDGTQTIEDSYALLRDLGRIFDVTDRAEKLIAESRQKIAVTVTKVAGRPAPRVMLIIPGMTMGTSDFTSIGANGIWNDIIHQAGGTNAFAGTTKEIFANLSKEQVAAAKVDAVIVVQYQDPNPQAAADKLFARFPQWEASRNKRYVVLSDSAYLGPDNATAVDRTARMLHPDAF